MTMAPAENRKTLVAIDLGAQSCRVALLRWNRSEPEIEVIHRFANQPHPVGNELRWDIHTIFEGIKTGLHRCCTRAPEGIASIAVDGWAVDYVRLDAMGDPIALPFCYRDARTEAAEKKVHALLPPSRLYSLTGIQVLRINTLYQLYADKIAGLDPSLPWLNLPEYITYCLCGYRVGEYTNATHTGLVDLGTHSWCPEIFDKLGLDVRAAPAIVPSGSVLGPVTRELASLSALQDTKVIAPACHDTASAIAAIPATGDDWAFISSGTWSLVGTVLDSPCVTGDAHVKNVNGMWLLNQCLDELKRQGIACSLPDLLAECASLSAPRALIDIDDPQLILPGRTIDKINSQLVSLGRPALAADRASLPPLVNTIFHSMAARYAEVLSAISRITGKKLRRLFIVGGGSQNALLNQITGQRTGLEIILGSAESTTIGNFAVQMAALQQDQASSTGVTAKAVAGWAEQIVSRELVQGNVANCS